MALVANEADLSVQRAIEGRYLPAARAERREAQARYRQEHRPAPSTVGWNTRPTNADKRKAAADAAVAAHRAEQLSDEDKALRAAAEERERELGYRRHATAATMAEANRPGRLARLFNDGVITADQLQAAREIDDAYQAEVRDVTTRTASFETRIDAGARGDGKFFEALGAVRREQAYDRWRAAMAQRAPIGAVLAMIVGDPVGYSVVARRFGMGDRRARAVLLYALDLWPYCYAEARRSISAADLAAAQVGL